MKILKAATLSAFLAFSGCNRPVQVRNQIHQPETNMDLSQLFDKSSNAMIVSFGEYHALNKAIYDSLDYRLESERFYRDIIPGMVSLGFHDLVIEGLFSDVSVDDLSYFARHGSAKPGSLLEYNLREFPDPNIMQLMQACRNYNINVHPGGISSVSYFLRAHAELVSSNNDDDARAAALYYLGIMEIETITDNIKAELDSIASLGRKVMSFSGIRHNNCDSRREVIYDNIFEALTDERREVAVSFGESLFRKYNEGYLEVDIISPETLGTVEVNGVIEPIITERIPYEYILLSTVAHGRGLIRNNSDNENRLLIILNSTRN